MKVHLTLTPDELRQLDAALAVAIIHAPNRENQSSLVALNLKFRQAFTPFPQESIALVTLTDKHEHNNVILIETPLPNGCTLYRRANEAGGRTYYSDEIGGGVWVWDTALVDSSTLIAALNHENTLLFKEAHERRTFPTDPETVVAVQQAETDGAPPRG